MKNAAIILTLLLIASLLAGCSSKVEGKSEIPSETVTPTDETTESDDKGKVMMATTTSTSDTGLLDFLAPMFKEATGYTLMWTAVGTGEALKMGEDGQVDLVFVHAESSEEKFVADGFGIERFPVMYNDFVVLGPKGDVVPTDDIASVFSRIMEDNLPFISRGDDSGTDRKEKEIWKSLGIDPGENPNYIETGQSMGAAIIMADEKKAYCLSDRGTYLKHKNDSSLGLELEVLCEGAENLMNPYGIIAVNPAKYPEVSIEGANVFIEWICSKEGQEAIRGFGVKEFGQALFIPNAEDKQ